MIPKKAKELIAPTADITDCNEDLVEAVTSFYWTEVRAALVEMREPNIHLLGLGTFSTKKKKLPELRAKYAKMFARYEQLKEENKMTFQRFAIMKDIEIKLNKVTRLQELVNNELLRKEQAKKKREDYDENIKKLSSNNGGSL